MSRVFEAIALPAKGLALFRKLLGVLCLIDAVGRLSQARLLYSDEGLLPRWALNEFWPGGGVWSLYCISGQFFFVVTLLLGTVALGARQAWGRSARWSRVALWLLLMSVQQRNPAVTDAADDLLRLMLFWDMFLPDQVQSDTISLATLGLQWQLTLAVLATSLWGNPERWLLSAHWGLDPQAARFPWLGISLAVAVPAIWWSRARRILLWPLGLMLLSRAVLLDPTFPFTLAAGLSCLWAPQAHRPRGDTVPALRPAMTAAWALACIFSLTFTLRPDMATPWLAPAAQGMGLGQDWSRVYPLAAGQRAEVILRAQGYSSALFNLDLNSGRRLRLYSQSMLARPGLAIPLGQSFAETLGLRQPVEVWLRCQRLSGSDLSLPRQEVQMLERVNARLGAITEPQAGGEQP